MSILNTFIEQASNIWWGIATAVLTVAILYAIIYAVINGGKRFSPLSYFVAVPLLPLLAVQFFLLFGSVSLKHTSTEVAGWIDAFVPETSAGGLVSRENINEITRQATVFFPIATKLIDTDLITQDNGMSLGEALTHKVHTYLNWYIIRRSAWIFGFIVIGTTGILFFTEKARTQNPYRSASRPKQGRTSQFAHVDERTRRQRRHR